MKQALLVMLLLVWAGIAQAVEPGEVLSDPVLEDRARSIRPSPAKPQAPDQPGL